jgi:hypothetical protein
VFDEYMLNHRGAFPPWLFNRSIFALKCYVTFLLLLFFEKIATLLPERVSAYPVVVLDLVKGFFLRLGAAYAALPTVFMAYPMLVG